MERCGREWTTGRAQESSGKKRGPLPLACMANKRSGGGGGGPSLNSGETVFPDPRRRRSKTRKKERENTKFSLLLSLSRLLEGKKEKSEEWAMGRKVFPPLLSALSFVVVYLSSSVVAHSIRGIETMRFDISFRRRRKLTN